MLTYNQYNICYLNIYSILLIIICKKNYKRGGYCENARSLARSYKNKDHSHFRCATHNT